MRFTDFEFRRPLWSQSVVILSCFVSFLCIGIFCCKYVSSSDCGLSCLSLFFFFFLFLIGRKGFRIRCCCGFCCLAVIFVFGEIFVLRRILLVNLVGCDGTVAGVSSAISFRGDNEHR